MRSLFAIIVGVGTFLFSIGYTIEAMVNWLNLDRSDKAYESVVLGLIITIILSIVMAVLSVFMVLGVRKNRLALITPWLIFEIVGTICGLLSLCFGGFKHSGFSIFWDICFIIIGFILWYPVYILWRNMRQNEAFSNRQSPPYELTVNYKGDVNEGGNMSLPEVV